MSATCFLLQMFLLKIPGGLFGAEIEHRLLNVLQLSSHCDQCDAIHRYFNNVLVAEMIALPLPCNTHPFNGPLSGTIRVSRYQKGKTNLDFTEARDSEWQWNPLGHMQVCTSLQTDNHTSTPPLSFFYRPDALPAAQPTVSKH